MDPDKLHCFVPTSKSLEPTGDGILRGRSFVAKDLFAIEGHISSFGHPRWRSTHESSRENAPVIDALLTNGAAMKGLTKMDQLAYSLIGNVGEGKAPINSLYPDRFTGGSSSGSASAVVGGVAEIGIGTDTSGSIRVPAAACGLFGIRPTHSSISSHGVIPLAQSLDTVGILTRDASILAITLNVLLEKGAKSAEQVSRVLLPAKLGKFVDKKLFNIVRKAADFIGESLDVHIESADLSDLFAPSIPGIYTRVQGREIWNNHRDWIGENMRYLAEDVRIRLEKCELASGSPKHEKLADERALREYAKRLEKIVDKKTVMVLPVLPTLMPKRKSTIQEQRDFRSRVIRLTALASISGMPEVVIPFFDKSSGITTGIGILAARGQDRLLGRITIEIAGKQERISI